MSDIPERLASALADRYRIERGLGEGGMATVYLAHDLKHGRDVAIKVLRPDLAAVIGAERFLAEIRTTAALQHPHILPLFDSGEADGFLFYVMPYVEGETVRDRLARDKPLPVADAVRIATEVASALDYAHRHGVIHRDIKPENILLHDGAALVADFGIALAVQSAGAQRMTQTGLSLGTPQYMSPEQAMGERQIDARSDVYALGAVLYEMLTGDPPFTGSTVQAIVAKVVSAEPEPVTMLRRSTPAPVAAAVHRALEKLPADRFATAQAFAEALAAPAAAGAAAPMRVPLTKAEGWRRTVRRPLPLALAVLLIAVAALAVREWLAARRAAAPTVLRFTVDLPPHVTAAATGMEGQSIAISPDGSALAFAAVDADGVQRLFVRRLSELAPQPLAGTEGAAEPFFSADGQRIAFWAAGRLLVVGARGGTPQPLASVPEIVGGTWTPGGDLVVSADGRLVAIPSAGGAARPITALDSAHGEVLQFFPVALPDGRHILYESWGTGAQETVRIGVLSLATGRSRRLDLQGTNPLGMAGGALVFGSTTGSLLAAPVDIGSGRVEGPPVTVVNDVATGNRGSAEAALSASGTLTYQSGGQASQLVLADPRGSTPVLPEVRAYAYPRYSPDGKRVAVTIETGATSDVWLYEFATRSLRRLTSGGSVNERPEWSPDGGRVLFRTDRGPLSSIWWQPIDESAPATPLLSGRRAAYFEAVMSPDARAIIYQVDTAGTEVGWRMLQGDTTTRSLGPISAALYMPRVSPDGRWVAYVTRASGTQQVAVQPFPGPGPQVQISTDGGGEPVWARDGRRLFFRNGGQFIVATLATTPTLRVTSRTTFMPDTFLASVSPHANYDVSPDGTHLLVLAGDAQRLVVVHDWWVEVRDRLRASGAR